MLNFFTKKVFIFENGKLRVVDVFDAQVEVEATARGGHVMSVRVDGERAELVARVEFELV
jgi:hypothetical protein